MAAKSASYEKLYLAEEIQELLDTRLIFQEDEEGHMVVRLHQAPEPGNRAFLFVGDNASGKSLFRHLLTGYLKTGCSFTKGHKVEHIEVSMATRSGGGMRASFMYGPFGDDEQSTGARSLSPLEAAFSTAKGREHLALLTLDEMELGISPDYHWALGQHIAAQYREHLQALPHVLGMFVVTHSKELARGYVEGLEHLPHAMMFGSTKDQGLQVWLDAPVNRRSVQDLLDIQETDRQRHHGFNRFFKKG